MNPTALLRARWIVLAVLLCALAVTGWWLMGATVGAWSIEWAPAVSNTVPVEESTPWEDPGVSMPKASGIAVSAEPAVGPRASRPGNSRLPIDKVQARPAAVQGQLSGQVRDNLGNPVPEAVVRVYPAIPAGQIERNVRWVAETRTDHRGAFAASVPAGDDLTVQVEHAEFAPADPLGNVTVTGDETLDVPTIVLRIGRMLRGRVHTPQGHGVAQALVTLERSPANPLVAAAISGRVWDAQTDTQGRFLLRGLPDGEFRLRILPPMPWASASVEVVLPTAQELTIPLQRGTKLAGRIVDPAGLPVTDALLCLTSDAPGEAALHQETTSRDGQFAFTAIQPGVWRLRVSAHGYLTTDDGPHRVLDDPMSLNPITLHSRPRIQLSLSVARGSLPASATVELLVETPTGVLMQSGLPPTEHRLEGGRVTLPGPEPGRYALLVNTGAWAPARSDTFLAADLGADVELPVRLLPAAQVTGRVTAVEGSPLSRVLVEAWPAWPQAETVPDFLRRAAVPAAMRPRVFTNSDGCFTIGGLAEGQWDLVLRAPRHAQPPQQRFTAVPGKTHDLGTVQVPSGASVEGTVCDDDKLPVRGSEVDLVPRTPDNGTASATTTTTTTAPVSGHRCRTDDQGRFELYGVPAGSYWISAVRRSSRASMLVYADHERSRTAIELREGQRQSVQLQIRNVNR